MTYEYNRDVRFINNFPNPFSFENVFLFLAAFATAAGSVAANTAKGLFQASRRQGCGHRRAAAVAALVLSIAVKLLMEALSQAQFYLGRKLRFGLACELPLTENRIGHGTEGSLETYAVARSILPSRGGLTLCCTRWSEDLTITERECRPQPQHFHSLIAFACVVCIVGRLLFSCSWAHHAKGLQVRCACRCELVSG
ncbi:hypothetical protein [Massilia phosphatilytica]